MRCLLVTEEDSGVFASLPTIRGSLRVHFSLRDGDKPLRKRRKAFERHIGWRVRVRRQVFFRLPLRGNPSRRNGVGILSDQLPIGQATT
jgi:hypothetical protein